MTKRVGIVFAAMTFVAFVLSGCALFPADRSPSEIIADGKVVSMETKVFSNGNAVWNDSLVFTLYRTGADGLFCTLRARRMYYADTIYRWEDWTDDTDKLIVKTFSADVNEYIVSLLKEYRLAE